MLHEFDHRRVEAQVFGGTAAGDDQRVVVLGAYGGELGIEGEQVTRLFAVGLVAFEIVYGRAHLLAAGLAGTYGVHGMADHLQGLKRNHRFVVLGEVTGEHENHLCCHLDLLGVWVARATRAPRAGEEEHCARRNFLRPVADAAWGLQCP